jgi:hypothetical protein
MGRGMEAVGGEVGGGRPLMAMVGARVGWSRCEGRWRRHEWAAAH